MIILLVYYESVVNHLKPLLTYVRGKRMDCFSSSSSPESTKPPAKSVKFAQPNAADMADIWKMLNMIRADTNKLLEENRALRALYNELQTSLQFHVNNFDKLVKENKTLKEEVASLKKSLNNTNDDMDDMYHYLSTAINQIDDLEQYTRKHNLKIHGIPESYDENLAENVTTLGNALNVSTRHDDIDICHRLPSSRNSTQPKPIIVRFKSYKQEKRCTPLKNTLKTWIWNNFSTAQTSFTSTRT